MNKITILNKAAKFPHVFKVLPIVDNKPSEHGTWGNYPIDNVMQLWINSSHPEAINFYKQQIKTNGVYEMNKALTVQEENSIGALLKNNMKAITSILPRHLTPEKAARLLYSLLVKNPALGRCTQSSIMNCFLESSSLGLEIGGALHHASLIPFKNRKNGTSEAALVVEYNGKIMLAQNTGNVLNVSAYAVYEKDDFNYSLGLKPDIHHIPSDEKDPGKLKYAYAVINYTNGGQDFEVINERIAMDAKGRSAAKFKKDSPWNQKDLEYQQWKKTAIHRLMNRVPKSSEKINTTTMNGDVPDHVVNIQLEDLSSVQIPEKTASNDVKKEEESKQSQEKEAPDFPKEIKQAISMKKQFPDEFNEACISLGCHATPENLTVAECLAVGGAVNSILDMGNAD